MNRNTSYRPQSAKTTSVKKTTTKSSSIVAQTADLDSTGKKIITKTAVTHSIPKPPSIKKRGKSTQASLSSMSAEEAETFIGDYRSNIISTISSSEHYNSVFNNEDEEDNNAILLSNFTVFLKTLNSSRKKCQRFFTIWLPDGLYIFIFKSLEFEKNYYFFPASTVPQYRFNGKPRYYYFTIQNFDDLVNSIVKDSVLIITEKLVDYSEGTFPESPKGSGKEVLEFIVSAPSGTSAKQSRDISFDTSTFGYIPEEFFDDSSTASAADFKLPLELDALKAARKGYDSWDIVSNVVNHNDTLVKKMMKSEMRTCQIVYDKEKNSVGLTIDNQTGPVSFIVENEKPSLENLDDPITFRLVYVANNILKGLSKDTISQRMYMNITLPGFIKIEVATIEHTVGTILSTKDLDFSTVVTTTNTVNEQKIIRKKKTIVPDEETPDDETNSLTVPVPKVKATRSKKVTPVNDIY